jgi:beta-mannosidase
LAGQWTLGSLDGRHKAPFEVPGDVHSALYKAQVIAHPYVGRNEYGSRWVAEEDWEATRHFDFDGDIKRGWYLDITYLDTVAHISINGALVLAAANSFRRYRPDVGHALRTGDNEIKIVFHSSIRAAAELQAAQPFYIPYSTNNCPIPNPNMLRKAQCHNGWDWNIAIAPFGLYGDIRLCAMDGGRVEHVQVEQQHSGNGAVRVDVIVTHRFSSATKADFQINFAGETRWVSSSQERHVESFEIAKPNLWWPAGSGTQHLYELAVVTRTETIRRRVGLRHAELITTPDAVGARFAFRVNGCEIFCRGANWIPADALPSAATPELTAKLLRAAVAANMNMVRVGGGGFYEQDFFYDLCDELGIMVWQDFMFACSLYPSTPQFLSEVCSEVDYQVRRLAHHASVVLWCGDNELLGALTWFKESRENRDRYLVNYDRLNRTIEETMKAADATAIWWPSSPSPGLLSFGDAWHDDRSGDMHFWSVWHEGKSFEHYRDVKPRFCSEFGFQSFPSMATIKTFAEPSDMNIASPVMESHQKNAGGNARIAETMFRYFRFPASFPDFVYVSQIQQGLAMRTAIECWRTLKPHCMGTLYWQLNDTWPVASWSGLDHGGGWKALHYMARRFFEPVAVFAVPAGDDIVLTGVNDTLENVVVTVKYFAMSVSGTRIDLGKGVATLPTDRAIELARIPKAQVPDDAILHFIYSHDETSVSSHFALKPYKNLAFEEPGIVIQTKFSDGDLMISLSGRRPAYFLSLECSEAGHFSDNAFDLLPGEVTTVRFTPFTTGTEKAAAASLVVRNLFTSTHT